MRETGLKEDKFVKSENSIVYSKIISYGFVVIFAAILAACIISDDSSFSEMENRNLQKFPKLTVKSIASGNFMSEFEKYSADQVVGRDLWVMFKNSVDIAIGKKDNGAAYRGKEGYLFPIGKIDKAQLEKNISYLKIFQEKVEPEVHGFSIMAVPTASEILKDKFDTIPPLPDETVAINQLKSEFGERVVEVTSELEKHKGEYIYYKTDHHWTALGAYYGYKAAVDSFGCAAKELSEYEKDVVNSDFLGTTYSKIAGFGVEPDSIFRYSDSNILESKLKIQKTGIQKKDFNSIKESPLFSEEKLSTKDKYGYFLGGNDPLIRVESPQKNGKSILIIKDSYANCMIPFFSHNYEYIYGLDLRYYRGSIAKLVEDIREDTGLTDILIIYNAIQISNDKNLVFLVR